MGIYIKMLETMQIEIPEGFKFRYEVYKVRSLSPTDVEGRGRNPTLDASSKDMDQKQQWTVKFSTFIQSYNRETESKQSKKSKKSKRSNEVSVSFDLFSIETE